MGNSPLTVRLSNGDQYYNVQLGESAAICFRGREVKLLGTGEITESWQVSYKVDKSTCNFRLTKTTKRNTNSPHLHEEMLDVKINDGECEESKDVNNSVTVRRAEAGLLQPSHRMGKKCWKWERYRDKYATMHYIYMRNLTTNAWGGITETNVDSYGSGRRRGLMVCEWKKKSKDENPYMGTVAHYYVNAENGKDVGLSVAVKRIRASDNGHLDFAVDGPEHHPVAALFKMFDEVHRTGTWKPTYCPHCANNCIIQRQRGISCCQSESEDSDKDNNVPTSLLHHCRRNTGGINVANDGVVKGNNNGPGSAASCNLRKGITDPTSPSSLNIKVREKGKQNNLNHNFGKITIEIKLREKRDATYG